MPIVPSTGPDPAAASTRTDAGYTPPAVQPLPSLTLMERRILEFMVSYLRDHTYQPSIREIGQRFGIKSTKTVSDHLQSIAEKGFIERDPARSRGIRILGLDLNAQVASLPCYENLEEATAGSGDGPAEAQVAIDEHLVGTGGGFMVRAPRSVLAGAGIRSGDLLVIEPMNGRALADGDLVVAGQAGRVGYYQARAFVQDSGSGLALHRLGADAPGGAAAAAGKGAADDGSNGRQSPHPVIVGRVASLFRHMGGRQPVAMPVVAH